MSQATAPRRVSHARLPLGAAAPGVRKSAVSAGTGVRLRVVAPADSRHSGGLAFVVCCVVVLALGLAALLQLNTQHAQQSFTIDALQAKSARITDTQQSLRSQLQGVDSAASLANRAQALGLVPAAQFRYVEPDGKTIGVAKGVTGAAPLILGPLTTGGVAQLGSQAVSGVSLGSSVGAPASAKAAAKPVPAASKGTKTDNSKAAGPTSGVTTTKPKKPSTTKPSTTKPSTTKPSTKQPADKGAKSKKTPGTPATTTR